VKIRSDESGQGRCGFGQSGEEILKKQSAHSDKRGKPGGFPSALFKGKIVLDGQQSAYSQDFASGEHNFLDFENRFLPCSYGDWLSVIRIDTICRVVIILRVGKYGNPLLFQVLAPQGDWRKIDSV
jgi:hypothetical protein